MAKCQDDGDINIQEIGALIFVHRLSQRSKKLMFGALGSFGDLVEWAEVFQRAGVEPQLWFQIFCSRNA